MAMVVEHKETGAFYVLIGAGFGAWQAMKPNMLLGNLLADKTSGELALLAVCDLHGEIGWFRSEELRVVAVDGRTPEALLLSTPDV